MQNFGQSPKNANPAFRRDLRRLSLEPHNSGTHTSILAYSTNKVNYFVIGVEKLYRYIYTLQLFVQTKNTATTILLRSTVVVFIPCNVSFFGKTECEFEIMPLGHSVCFLRDYSPHPSYTYMILSPSLVGL